MGTLVRERWSGYRSPTRTWDWHLKEEASYGAPSSTCGTWCHFLLDTDRTELSSRIPSWHVQKNLVSELLGLRGNPPHTWLSEVCCWLIHKNRENASVLSCQKCPALLLLPKQYSPWRDLKHPSLNNEIMSSIFKIVQWLLISPSVEATVHTAAHVTCCCDKAQYFTLLTSSIIILHFSLHFSHPSLFAIPLSTKNIPQDLCSSYFFCTE